MNDNIPQEKVYYPETIQDLPFPGSDETFGSNSISSGGSTSNPVFNPPTLSERQIKNAQIARETIAQSFNTKTKKILGEYEFADQGAIKIGNFENGISGDIRISPNGFLARNNAGDTTVAIDGETGNAIFKGEIQAGDFTIADEEGLVSLSNFYSDEITGGFFETTSSSYTDITGMTINLPRLTRPAYVLFFISAQLYGGPQNASNDFYGVSDVVLVVDGATKANMVFRNGRDVSEDTFGNGDVTTIMTHDLVQVPAGQSVAKLQVKATQISAGNYKAAVDSARLTYIILGR